MVVWHPMLYSNILSVERKASTRAMIYLDQYTSSAFTCILGLIHLCLLSNSLLKHLSFLPTCNNWFPFPAVSWCLVFSSSVLLGDSLTYPTEWTLLPFPQVSAQETSRWCSFPKQYQHLSESASLFPTIVMLPAVASCAQTVDVPKLWTLSEADLPLPLDGSQWAGALSSYWQTNHGLLSPPALLWLMARAFIHCSLPSCAM